MGNFTQDEKRRLLHATGEVARLEREKKQRWLLQQLGILAVPVVLIGLAFRLFKVVIVFIRDALRK